MRFSILALTLSLSTAAFAEDKADLFVVHKIRDQAFNHSEIMDTLFYLTDVNGPRVTNSTGFKCRGGLGSQTAGKLRPGQREGRAVGSLRA